MNGRPEQMIACALVASDPRSIPGTVADSIRPTVPPQFNSDPSDVSWVESTLTA